MTRPVTGQYECAHRSGVGLDYFTSRVDRLTLTTGGRFTMIKQDRSRISNAAQSLLSGQPVAASVTNAPETRREGSYSMQANTMLFRFDDGEQMQGQLAWNGDGLQYGPDFFNKVSDSTLLPPTHRMKQDMDDIAKGLKIAGTIGGMAMKAAKTIQDTIQSTQETGNTATGQPGRTGQAGPGQGAPQPYPSAPPTQWQAQPVNRAAPQPQASNTNQAEAAPLFCDQCGAPARPGKRFCNHCGAELPPP